MTSWNRERPTIIRISEALHEKKIARIADMILDNRERIKIVLISGLRLRETILHNDYHTAACKCPDSSEYLTDDYFVNKDHNPCGRIRETGLQPLKLLI
jgi:uridine kinase